jgi:hypothetical protein
MLTNTKGGASMAGRPLRLLLLAITIELFAVVFVLSPFGNIPYVLIIPFVGRLVGFAIGVIGLAVALAGYRARE